MSIISLLNILYVAKYETFELRVHFDSFRILFYYENRIPCNENRFFLVRIDLQAFSCKSYRVWVCSVTLEQVRLILRSKSVGAMATPTISAGSVARAGL